MLFNALHLSLNLNVSFGFHLIVDVSLMLNNTLSFCSHLFYVEQLFYLFFAFLKYPRVFVLCFEISKKSSKFIRNGFIIILHTLISLKSFVCFLLNEGKLVQSFLVFLANSLTSIENFFERFLLLSKIPKLFLALILNFMDILNRVSNIFVISNFLSACVSTFLSLDHLSIFIIIIQ